jgi:hypothetical protein
VVTSSLVCPYFATEGVAWTQQSEKWNGPGRDPKTAAPGPPTPPQAL